MTTKAELLKMVRRNCIRCMGDQPSLVDGCTCPDCEFFEFRDGTDPRPARKGNRGSFRKGEIAWPVAKNKPQISTKGPR